MRQDALAVGRSVRRNLAALIAAVSLAWSSPASALFGPWPDLGGEVHSTYLTLLLRAKVICATERIGNTLKTWSCQDGYVCAPNHACNPGPAVQREMEKKREEETRRQAEEQRKREIEQARQAEQARQQAEAARQAALARQLAQKHANTPNPFGPASADCNSTITDKDHPQGGRRVNCNTGGTINDSTGPLQHPANRPPSQQVQVPQLQIPGFTLTLPGNSTGDDSAPPTQSVTKSEPGITDEPMMKYALSPDDDEKTLEMLWPFLTQVCYRAEESHGHLMKNGQMSPAVEQLISMNTRIERQKGRLTNLREVSGKSLDLPLRNAEYFMIGLLGRGGGISDELYVAAAPTYDYAKDHPNSPEGVTVRLLQFIKSWRDGDRGSWNMQATKNPNSPGGGFIWALIAYDLAKDVHPSETTAEACRSELASITRDKVLNALKRFRQELLGDPDSWATYPTRP
jgi:hypothetical protein